ncbi:MAG: hypothetical protein IPP50_15980 [Piscinibacter sp.]|nr:hypothetical protein [Piscinibacter sp.]
MRSPHRFRPALALLLAALGLLAACGGQVAESLARLIEARFVPATQAVERGTTQRVTLEIRCSDGIESPFGRLGVEMRVDAATSLGLQATTIGTTAGRPGGYSEGFQKTPCRQPTGADGISEALVPMDVSADAAMAPGTYVLRMRVQVEPISTGDLPKDQTFADLTVVVTAPPGEPVTTGNLIVDPGFETVVAAGGLPAAPGFWQGDASNVVTAEGDIMPRSGAQMLKFIATGAIGSTNTVASQLWQTVDLREYASVIGGGTAQVDAAAWFNRIVVGTTTDRRFDLRLLAFDGNPADVGTRYAAGTWLAQQAVALDSQAFLWQQVQASLVLPANTSYVLVEIYAFEDVQNDADGTEFAGHYADDVSLVLVRP